MRDRRTLLLGLFIVLVLATLGLGLFVRHGQLVGCSIDAPGCPGSAERKPFAYQAGDGRVEGNAGDLIVLYCQPEQRAISVYGIVNSAGIQLASFEVDRVRAAGAPGLTVNLGDRGFVSMKSTTGDTFYVVLKGGVAAAAGLDRYAKLFFCAF